MIELYKAFSGKYDAEATAFIRKWSDSASRTSTRTNTHKIFPQHANSNRRKNVFQLRSASLWNSLPENIVNAPTLNTFKNNIDHFLANRSLYFNYRANIEEREP